MVLGGKSAELILGNDGKWRAESDDVAKIELLTGDTETYYWNDEHWKVTTVDGTQYHFGLNRLPGWTAGDRENNSVLGMPVFSNHNGDPCVDAQGVVWWASWCHMAYRWNLDYVVDRNGNTMSLWYSKETNKTALAGNASYVTGYDRYGLLERIEYGTRAGTGTTRESRPGATPPARVVFTNVDRCLSGSCPTHDRTNYPDTAWDLDCAGASCANNMAPSFWSAKRVSQIATEVYSGSATTYNRVDEWAFGAEFPIDASGSPLWLSSITHSGKVGGTKTLPPIQFAGSRLRNRADWDPNGTMADPMKYRIVSIRNETGGQIDVTYGAQDAGCQFGSPFPDPDNNDKRCFPRYWTNPTGSSGWAWWHKYIVTKVVEKDLVGGSPEVETNYNYGLDGAGSTSGPVVLWAYDKGASVFASSTGFRSWADFRGYATVTATVGTVAGQQSQTKTLYFRGLNGDRTDNGYYARTATITNSLGEVTADEPQFAGMVHETQTLAAPNGQVLSKSISSPSRWLTSTRDITNSWAIPPTQWSYIARTTRERTLTWLPLSSTWRTAEKNTTWNTSYGVVETIEDLGDPTATVTTDDSCTRHFYTYPASGAPYLISYPNRVEQVGVKCATTPVYPGDAISDTRFFYDSATSHTTAPTKGNATRVDKAASYTGSTPNLITTTTTVYDAWGRPTSLKNALNQETRTVYTQHLSGQTEYVKVINPAGHEVLSQLNMSHGQPVTVTDPNGKVTASTYDPLGRLLKVWEASRSTTLTPDTEYQYEIQQGAPSYRRARVLGPNGHQLDAYEIFDGLLRNRQTQSTAPDGKRVIQDVQYDQRGLKAKESVFYNNTSGPTATLYNVDAAADGWIERQLRYVYDGVGRQTADELWSKNALQFKSTTVYQGDRTAIIPPAGGTTTMNLTDVQGRVIEKRQFVTTNLNGAFDKTSYTFNRAGRLAKVVRTASAS